MKRLNCEHFGNIQRNIAMVEQRLNALDLKEEVGGLIEEGKDSKKCLQEEFWRLVMYNKSLLRQKARSKWLRGLNVNESWVEEPIEVKEEV